MKTRNKFIVLLAIFGLLLFGVVHFLIIPDNNKKAAEYAAAQLSPKTHDIENVLKYKNKYMGNSSNLINLFRALPLCNYDTKYQLYPDKLTAEVKYEVSTETLGGQKTIEAILYNSTAAFALIDNLQVMVFSFSDRQYSVSREATKAWYGEKALSNLLDKKIWQENVQSKLSDSSYVSKWSLSLITPGGAQ